MRRIRLGEALLGSGAIALFVLLFADWFKGGGVSKSGWSSVGWGLDILFVLVILLALSTVAVTAAGAKPAIALGPGVVTAAVAIITLPVALIRVLITQPDLDLGLSNADVTVQLAGYLGLVALIVIILGAWISLSDERTDAPDSAYTPPPPRPVPGS
jgi:hypothetical protein